MGGGWDEEIRVIFQVLVNINSRVRLAWAGDVPVEAIGVEVGIIAGGVIRPDGVVDVETGKSVGEHWCGVGMRGKFEGYAE